MADPTPRKLVLIDAYGLLFRAYFGGRGLTTGDHRPTGALYGFTSMLFMVIDSEKPDAMVVCWDAPAQTHRSREFEAYKAHRAPADPQLKEQLPVARHIVEAFGIQSAEIEGYEADDLIGTLAATAARDGYEVTIVTGDTDQLQLAADHVRIQMTVRGVTEMREYDEAAVRERYGIAPERIPDWKALVGDTSDNIPGVAGVGDKTATALLQKFDTLENLLAHVADVEPERLRSALRAGMEQAPLSKRLATIVCDVPLYEPIAPFAPTEENWAALRELFTKLEFRSILHRIPQLHAPESAGTPGSHKLFEARTVEIGSDAMLEAAIAECVASGAAAIQPQFSGSALPMLAELTGIALAPSAEVGYHVRVANTAAPAGGLFDDSDTYAIEPAALRKLVESPAIRKAGYNTKFVEILLERAGLHPTPFTSDVLISAYLLNAGRSSYPLDELADIYLGSRYEPVEGARPEETIALECAVIAALAEPMQAKIAALGMEDILDRVEMPLIPILAEIEQIGILVDGAYLSTLSMRLGVDLDALAKDIYALAEGEFSIGSTKQLQTVLFEKLKLPTGKKTATGFSTGADVLDQLAVEYPIARKILEWREIQKLKSTYADALTRLVNPRTGRIHTSLNQAVASTGRLSSSDPNLQNIPNRSKAGREIRRSFVSATGSVLLSCDYSQIELRVLAHITKDPALVTAFAADEDVHAATASTVFAVPLEGVTPDMRRQAKTINFAVIYGQSAFALASTLGVDNRTASDWIKAYFDRLPGVRRYVDETSALAHEQKYVSTLLGRRRYLPDLDSGNASVRQFAERAAVNMPIQGTAADIMKLAMIAVYDDLKRDCPNGCKLLLQVHDELLFEIEEHALDAITVRVRHAMEQAYPLDVPLRVDAKAGPNWAEMKPVHRPE